MINIMMVIMTRMPNFTSTVTTRAGLRVRLGNPPRVGRCAGPGCLKLSSGCWHPGQGVHWQVCGSNI